MLQLILHHTYIGGSTVDVSGRGNHGNPQDVALGIGDAEGSYEFTHPTSGIMVAAAPSLENLLALRIRMKVRPAPWDGNRRNLMEGFISFALVLDGDGHLDGSIVDADGVWKNVSDPDPLSLGRWHEVEMVHDGLSTLVLKVDAQVVAARQDIYGPVRSVGPLGVAIGRWPDANAYAFNGHIGELQLWRFDPVRTALQFLDCCCDADVSSLEDVLSDLRAHGIDWTQVRTAAAELQKENLDFTAAIRERNPDDARALGQVLVAIRSAMLHRNGHQLAALQRQAESLIEEGLGPTERAQYEERVADIGRSIGWDRHRLDVLIRAFCLDVTAPPRNPDPRNPITRRDPWDDVRIPEQFPSITEPGSIR